MDLVFDIQRFSLYDGPGIRTTVFFKGCPLHLSVVSQSGERRTPAGTTVQRRPMCPLRRLRRGLSHRRPSHHAARRTSAV